MQLSHIITNARAASAAKQSQSTPYQIFSWRPSFLQIITILIVCVILVPLVYLIMRALGTGAEGVEYLLSARVVRIISNSLVLAVTVVAGAITIGIPFAWLTSRTNLPFRRFWLVSGMLSMVIPSYIGAMMYITAFGPRGMLQQFLEPVGVNYLPSIYGFFGAWFSITLFSYPYIVLPVRAALLNIDPAQEESARSLGVSQWGIFRRVILPQLRPALTVGTLLTALYTLSDFGAVSLMRYDAFTSAIYTQYTNSLDRSRAALLALVLVAITVILLIIERRAAAKTNNRNYRAGTGVQRKPRPVNLGKWKIPALIFCAFLVIVSVFTPMAVLTHWLIRGVSAGIEITALGSQTLNTAGASLLAALVVGVMAFPPALLAVRSNTRFNNWLVQFTYIGNVLPGLVIALAYVFFAANYLPAIYQSIPLLVIGYATRFLPLGIGSTRSALTQVNPRYEEAGRSLGLSAPQVIWRITIPLARGGVLAGMALVFLNAMKELPITILLSPTGFKTLPLEIWMANTDGRFAAVGAPTLVLVLVSALSLAFMLRRDQNH